MKNAGSDGAYANDRFCQLTRERQSHADDCSLGCRVRDLAYLTFIGRDRRGSNDYAATIIFVRLVGGHSISTVADNIKSANQVDLNGADKFLQIMHAIFAQQFFSNANSGGGDEDMQPSVLADGRLDSCGNLRVVRHVGLDELDAV